MEVAAVGISVDCTLSAILAVVAAALEHPPERRTARPEIRLPAVVLKANQCPRRTVQVHLGHQVTDMPARARHRAYIKNASAGELLAINGGVGVTQQLIAAADRQHHRAVLDGLSHGLALLRDEIWRDHRLLTVLATSKKDQIRTPRSETVAQADWLHVQLDFAPAAASAKRNY